MFETKVTGSGESRFNGLWGGNEERAWFVRLQDVHGVAGKAAMRHSGCEFSTGRTDPERGSALAMRSAGAGKASQETG